MALTTQEAANAIAGTSGLTTQQALAAFAASTSSKPTYTTTGAVTTRSLNAPAASATDVANVLATLIADLKAQGRLN